VLHVSYHETRTNALTTSNERRNGIIKTEIDKLLYDLQTCETGEGSYAKILLPFKPDAYFEFFETQFAHQKRCQLIIKRVTKDMFGTHSDIEYKKALYIILDVRGSLVNISSVLENLL